MSDERADAVSTGRDASARQRRARMAGKLQRALARSTRPPPTSRRSSDPSRSSIACSSSSSSASSTPARARSSTRSPARACSRRAPRRRRRDCRSCATGRHPGRCRASGGMSSPRPCAPPRYRHRRHAGHQRDLSRARAAHQRVRAAGRSRALRHLRRSAVHRKRALVPRKHPQLGQEDRRRDQQDRRPGATRGSRAGKRFVAEHAQALRTRSPKSFRVLASRSAAEDGRAGGEPVAGDRFDDLERYISSTLDQTERLRLKLLNPLGIGARLAQTTRHDD